MNSGRSINWRSVISYVLIGLALMALVVLGVVWAKNRSNSYAQKENGGGQQAPSAPPQTQPAPNQPTTEQPGKDQQPTAADQPAPTTGVQQVPATGAGNPIAFAGAIAVAAYAGVYYIGSRRRLIGR